VNFSYTVIGWMPELYDTACEHCGADIVMVILGVSTPTSVEELIGGGLCMDCGQLYREG